MKTLNILTLFLAAIFLSGCTDGLMGKISAYGGSAKIKCYSGTLLIFEGESTGRVSIERNRNGYSFIDKKDGKLKEVSGNCVIEYVQY